MRTTTLDRLRAESTLLAPPGRLDWAGVGACLIIIASLTGLLEGIGLAIGLLTALAWLAFGTPYAIAVGHVLLVVTLPTESSWQTIALAEVGFVALVLAPIVRAPRPGAGVLAAILAGAFVASATLFGLAISGLWLAAALALAATALGVYAVHRIGLVRLDLLPDAHP